MAHFRRHGFCKNPGVALSPHVPRNIVTDEKTVRAMVHIYCHDVHHTNRGALCVDCSSLMDYAEVRLEKCPFGAGKTTCRECPIHCYRPEPRAAMKIVMRHAGPRMLWRHPLLAIRHLWLEHKGPPPWPPARAGTRGRRVAEGG